MENMKHIKSISTFVVGAALVLGSAGVRAADKDIKLSGCLVQGEDATAIS